ncbi:hypothetical protein D3C77_318680 [compost metagenome]
MLSSSIKPSIALAGFKKSLTASPLLTTWIRLFKRDRIQRSSLLLDGRNSCSSGLNPSIPAYNVRKECVFTNVSTTLDFASATMPLENRLLFHGALSDSKAQRKASAPNSLMISQGSITFPFDLDIFCPFSSRICPVEMTALYGALPLNSVDTASKL